MKTYRRFQHNPIQNILKNNCIKLLQTVIQTGKRKKIQFKKKQTNVSRYLMQIYQIQCHKLKSFTPKYRKVFNEKVTSYFIQLWKSIKCYKTKTYPSRYLKQICPIQCNTLKSIKCKWIMAFNTIVSRYQIQFHNLKCRSMFKTKCIKYGVRKLHLLKNKCVNLFNTNVSKYEIQFSLKTTNVSRYLMQMYQGIMYFISKKKLVPVYESIPYLCKCLSNIET